MNGHVGKTTAGYEDMRNAERILEFGLTFDMVVCNTLFNKHSSRLITYSSDGVNTQIVCDLNIRIEREKKKLYIPKLKVWKLREAEAKKEFVSCVEEQCLTCDETGDVEGNWRKLKKTLIDSTGVWSHRDQHSGNPHGGMGKLKKLLKRRDDSGRNGRMAAVVKRDTLKLSEWHGDKCMR